MSLFSGSDVVNRADKVANIQVNTAEYGSTVPEILGTTKISGNVIYYDDFTAHERRNSQHVGKGGGSDVVNISYTYSVAAIFGLCEGQIDGIGKVWRDKEIYTYPSSAIELTLFDGSQTKPWTYTSLHHPEKALVYENLAYMAGVLNLGGSTSLPNFSFEVKGKLLDTGDGIDVNPADYILYVLRKAGLKDTQIKGIDEFREYCNQADILISSPPEVDAIPAQKIVNDIAELTNSYVFWSNDSFKIVPVSDEPIGGWTPKNEIIYDLTADDFLPQGRGELVTYQRKDTSAAYNQVTVEFINRENFYERESVSYEDTKSIEDIGLRPSPVKTCHYIYKKSRAVRLAEQLCRLSVYGRNRYTFRLDWAFCRLEPADLVTLTDKSLGIEKQVVIIDSVTEEIDGTITVTAIERPKGNYAPARFDVHETDRSYIDFNQPAPSVDVADFIQLPSDLMLDKNEILLGLNAPKGWGGARVWISDSGESYKYIGTVYNQARSGQLVNDISSASTELEIKLRHGELISATKQDAECGNTVCWINGECLSYEKVELLPNGNFRLSGLVRGQYGTRACDHTRESEFVRLDESLFRYRYRDEDVGKKIYVKFTSLNAFGSGIQDISQVKVWEYKINKYYIPSITNLRAYNRYRTQGDKSAIYDIVVSWDEPKMSKFREGQVWYKTNHVQTDKVVMKEGIPLDEIGFACDWTYGGSGKNEVVIPQANVGDTYIIAVTTVDEFGETTSPDTSPRTKILVAMKTELPNTPDNFKILFEKSKAIASWDEVINSDIAYYEVRRNKDYGIDDDNLLVRTQSLSINLPLTNRQGKLYLYSRNALGKYSISAECEYNKSKPITPIKPPKVKQTISGIVITIDEIPQDCGRAILYIDNGKEIKEIFTENTHCSISLDSGIYDITYAYNDLFGVGNKSPNIRIDIKPTIPSDWIDKEKLGLDNLEKSIGKIDKRIVNGEKNFQSKIENVEKGVESKISQLDDVISNTVTNKLNGVESRITQLGDTINLRVTKQLEGKADKAKLLSQINLCNENVLIDGKYIHVTGDTKFDKNVIVGGALQAGSVSADKLKVDSLSAISASLGKMESGLIRGVRYESQNGKAWIQDDEIHGMKISADVFEQAGYNIKNLDIIHVRTIPFQKIKYPDGVKPEDCVVMRTAYGDKFFESKEKDHWLAQEYCKKIGVTALDPNSSSIVLTKECAYYDDLFKKIIVDATPPSGRGLSVSADIDVTREGVAYAYKSKYMVARRNKESDYSSVWVEFYYVEIDLLVIRR